MNSSSSVPFPCAPARTSSMRPWATIRRPRLERLRGHPVDLRDEAQRLSGRQAVEEGEIFRHHADAPLDLDGIGDGIDLENADLAGRGTEEARQALDRRRLAGAVGPEKTVEAARRHP